MKQLLHSSGRHLVVGLGDRAFVIVDHGTRVLELVAPKKNAPTDEANPVQAVAIAVDEHLNTMFCAISRIDKSLAVYDMKNTERKHVDATVIHKTAKRVACLSFTKIPDSDESTSQQSALWVVVGGDLTGDACAYSCAPTDAATEIQQSRFLLGHTASMLTGVHVVGRSILTSDRDEKIRISSFPDTSIVTGFLFGHEAYISSMAVATSSNCPLCVSCSGGDGTVRLWNYREHLEIASMDTNNCGRQDKGGCDDDAELVKESEVSDSMVPSRVAIDDEGSAIAIIYDQCKIMDIFHAEYDQEKRHGCLKHAQRIHCETQPLSLSFCASYLCVLMQEPVYVEYMVVGDYEKFCKANLSGCQALRELARDAAIKMPDTVLEKGKDGKPTMKKIVEMRTSMEQQPWNNPNRKVVAKERNKRYKRRRKKQEEDEKIPR